jgi:flagellar biosynthesis/type III secretory pathway protein FliH
VTLTPARIVREGATTHAVTLSVPGQRNAPAAGLPVAAVVPKAVVDASDRAREIVERAESKAREIVERAESDAARLRERTLAEARADAVAELAAHTLKLRALEAAHDERGSERLIGLARLLAERLLGEALRLDPSHVVGLAQNALVEARGARRIVIIAHPDDARELEAALARAELERVAQIVPNPERGRGSLRFETEIGVLDAGLAPQLDRLVTALRATLRNSP